MKVWFAAAVLFVATHAHADDTKHNLFADSAALATVRPVALAGALQRLGPAWANLVRRTFELPSSINPLDPAVLQLTGIDPSGELAIGVRALRGGLHVRAALPLVEARVADALLQMVVGAVGGTVERSSSAWTAKILHGTPLVARLQGTTLVVDLVLANTTMVPTPADVLHVVPLKPPRAFTGVRGLQRRMTADDAAAVWGDLDAIAKLGLQRAEAEMSQAIKGADARTRAQLVRHGQVELAQCKQDLDTIPRTFDDALLAIHVTGPDSLRFELAEGARKPALDTLRAARTLPTRSLGQCGDANLCATLAGLPIPKPTRPDPKTRCSQFTMLAQAASSWPAMLASPKDLEVVAKLARGGRGLFFSIPAGDEPIQQLERYALTIELDPAVRGDLDRLLADSHRSATAPIRVDGRSVTTYSASNDASVSPVVAVDTQDHATIVSTGLRELVATAVAQVKPATPVANAPLGTIVIDQRGLRQLNGFAGSSDHALDGLQRVDGSMMLDDDVLRLDADLTLKPR